jgi:hypothetical protein
MILFPKQIRTESFSYCADKSLDDLKSDIQKLLKESKEWDFYVNLTGQFIGDYAFEMTPKWQFAIIRGLESKISYLNGILYTDESGRTRVDFDVRPNSAITIFFFVFPMIGLWALANANTSDKNNDALLVGLGFTFIVPIVMVVFGHFAKQGIKEDFIKTFDLKPLD